MTSRPLTEADGSDIDVELRPLDRVDGLAALWTDLEARADGSFFLSWLWIGHWLALLPPIARPHLLIARLDDAVVGLAVLCPHVVRRFGIVPTRCWMLHETGDRMFDRLFVEYNGILADRRCADVVTTACLSWLDGRLSGSDELVLGGLTDKAESAARRVAAQSGHTVQLRSTDTTLWVDLDRVRAGGGSYRAGLGKCTRAAVKRAERLYGERGPVTYRIAGTVAEALADFAALETLHQASWQARGEAGAFANEIAGDLCRVEIGQYEDGELGASAEMRRRRRAQALGAE